MSGRGGKRKAKQVSRSARAGVLFPVARMLRYLKRDTHHLRVGSGTPVYMAAVIEYLTGLWLNFEYSFLRSVRRAFVHVSLPFECACALPGFVGHEVTVSPHPLTPYTRDSYTEQGGLRVGGCCDFVLQAIGINERERFSFHSLHCNPVNHYPAGS